MPIIKTDVVTASRACKTLMGAGIKFKCTPVSGAIEDAPQVSIEVNFEHSATLYRAIGQEEPRNYLVFLADGDGNSLPVVFRINERTLEDAVITAASRLEMEPSTSIGALRHGDFAEVRARYAILVLRFPEDTATADLMNFEVVYRSEPYGMRFYNAVTSPPTRFSPDNARVPGTNTAEDWRGVAVQPCDELPQ